MQKNIKQITIKKIIKQKCIEQSVSNASSVISFPDLSIASIITSFVTQSNWFIPVFAKKVPVVKWALVLPCLISCLICLCGGQQSFVGIWYQQVWLLADTK